MRTKHSILLFGASITFAAVSACANGQPCTKEMALQAETEVPTLRSWAAVYDGFKKFQHCDDGGVAEGFSESITQLLASNWDTHTELADRDEAFLSFILRHIDESTPSERLKRIEENAATRCTEAKVCSKLLLRLGELDGER